MAQNEAPASGLEILSQVFREGQPIPLQYSCEGQNINPPLSIFNSPAATESLVLVMHDPDAPGGDFLHWLVWDIPPSTDTIGVNSVPVGAVQGKNSSGETGYTGPCPPSGTHRYIFDLYALSTTLDLPAGSSRDEVEKAMKGHVLADCSLTGIFSAPAGKQ